MKKGSTALSIGGLLIFLSLMWWISAFGRFKPLGDYFSCWIFWSLKCGFLSGASFLGGGGSITYSPIVFWIGAITMLVGLIRAGSAKETRPEPSAKRVQSAAPVQREPTVEDLRRQMWRTEGSRPSLWSEVHEETSPQEAFADFDVELPQKFADLARDLSVSSKMILAEAKRDGYVLSRLADRPVVVLRRAGEREVRFQSNEEIAEFGRQRGYAE